MYNILPIPVEITVALCILLSTILFISSYVLIALMRHVVHVIIVIYSEGVETWSKGELVIYSSHCF